MAEKDKKFYWIKLRQSLLTSEKVDFLMSQKNGADYVVLYQCLCLKTINSAGELANKVGELIIPFDEQKIERECKWFDIDTIRVAMSLYKKLGLIYEQENGILKITDFEDLVGGETYWAKQKRLQRNNFIPTEGYSNIKILSNEMVLLPNGRTKTIDNTRYGGNAFYVLDRSKGKCEICGSEENICIHHANGYSNEKEDLIVVCRSCHRKIESGEIELESIKKQVGQSLENFQPTLISNISISNNIVTNEEIDKYFDKIYSIYPRKVSKVQAKETFEHKLRGLEKEEAYKKAIAIYRMLENQNQVWQAENDGQGRKVEHTPYFSSWCNDNVENSPHFKKGRKR